MKRLLFVILLLFSSSVLAITTENIKKARDATVLVSQDQGGFGSGVVISPEGLIVTNYHVIHRAESIKVFFYDPKDLNYYVADIVGIDPVADLAVLQLSMPREKLPLTYLEFGTEFTIAEEVTAIGHPMGLQWSVTKGILNHLERPGKITPYVNVVQHSAQINQGNSGGPLVNENAELIGINTYILSPKGQWTGVAYAIRGDTVLESVNQIKEFGKVTYSAMKMGVRNMNEWFIGQVKAQNPDRNFPTNIYGLMVTKVQVDDYAHKQGIRNFDIIVAINGNPINYLGDLRDLMPDFDVGQVVKLIIIRDGHFRKHDYTIGRLDFDEVYLEFYDSSDEPRKRDIPTNPDQNEPNKKFDEAPILPGPFPNRPD